MSITRNILLNPGPATTTDTVKKALVVPDICPREKEFIELLDGVRKDLVRVVNGDETYVCIPFAGSGTAGMDACINSIVPADKKIAVVNNGAYGQRLVKIAQTYSLDCVELAFDWDKPLDVNRIEHVLKNDSSIACLAMVHHETTTGLLNPLQEVAAIARKHNCTFIADAISSYGAIPIHIQNDGIDFLISTSNKCIQGMAGLVFVICALKSLDNIRINPRRSFYLNLVSQYDCFEKSGEMQFTPPVQVIYALRRALDEFFLEGIEGRYKRYTENWRVLRSGLEEMDFQFLLKPEWESHILLTVLEPKNPHFNFELLHDKLYEKGFTIYPGKLDSLDTFRLANMGAIDKNDIKDFLHCMRGILGEMGVLKDT